MADGSPTVRRSARKKKASLTEEEENDGGFTFSRRSKRLRMLDKASDGASREKPKVKQTPRKSAKKTRSSKNYTKSNTKQEDSIKKADKEQSGDSGKESDSLVEESNEVISSEITYEIVPDKSIAKTKAKKKRRSSFIRGRNLNDSLEFCESDEYASVKSLHKDIPVELSNDKRLQLLVEKSLEIMSERIKSENCDKVPNYFDKAEEFISHLRTTFQQKFPTKPNDQAGKTHKRIIQPNPKNEQLEKYAKESVQVTERMTQEDKEWEEVLQKYQNPHERQEEDANNNTVVTLDSLSAEQQEFLKSSLPVDEMTRNLETVKLKSYLMIDQVCKTTNKLKTFNEVCGNYFEESTKSLGTRTFAGVAGTPRHMIHGVLGNKMSKLKIRVKKFVKWEKKQQ